MSTPGTPDTAPAPPPPPRRRIRKRILIPAILLGLALIVFLWAYIRGTWADTEVRNPRTADEGPITQLYRAPAPDGGIHVRCAIIVEARPRDVWAGVTDYVHHPEFLPY